MNSMTGMTVETRRMIIRQIYKASVPFETKPTGQTKIGGSRPAFSKMNEQVEYGKGSCNCLIEVWIHIFCCPGTEENLLCHT